MSKLHVSLFSLFSSLCFSTVVHADTFIIKYHHASTSSTMMNSSDVTPTPTYQGKLLSQQLFSNNDKAIINLEVSPKRYYSASAKATNKEQTSIDGQHLAAQLAVMEQFQQENPSVEYIVPADLQFSTESSSFSEQYNPNKQWDMIGQYSLHMDEAWSMLQQTPLTPITVAVVDTGLAANAPQEIKDNVVAKAGGQFYDEPNGEQSETGFKADYTDGGTKTHYHGTHVAGIIANSGKTNISSHLRNPGVNPTAKILVVKGLSDMGTGSDASIIPAIEWAAGVAPKDLTLTNFKTALPPANNHPARVVNLSLGLSRDNIYPPISDQEWQQLHQNVCAQYRDVANHVSQMGTVLVFAAGNDDKQMGNDLPSSCENMPILVVQASGPTGKLTYYSTHGDVPGTTVVTAPGGDAQLGQVIWSTVNGGYGGMQGTSQATPHVAGLTSLLFAIKPELSATAAIASVKNSQTNGKLTNDNCKASTDDDHDSQGNEYHFGIVNAPKAISCLSA